MSKVYGFSVSCSHIFVFFTTPILTKIVRSIGLEPKTPESKIWHNLMILLIWCWMCLPYNICIKVHSHYRLTPYKRWKHRHHHKHSAFAATPTFHLLFRSKGKPPPPLLTNWSTASFKIISASNIILCTESENTMLNCWKAGSHNIMDFRGCLC